MTRLLVAVLQLAGIRPGGRHARSRTNPAVGVTLAAVGAVAFSGLLAFVVVHLAGFYGVTR